MANAAYLNAVSTTGICTATAPAAPGVVWNLSSLSVSQAGPTVGPNSKVTIWDGAVGTGAAIFTAFLGAPGIPGGAGSVGIIQDIPLPRSPSGVQGIQASPGNAMNIQVTGTGGNQVSINARLSDGIPQV